jgi:hypothetical protein
LVLVDRIAKKGFLIRDLFLCAKTSPPYKVTIFALTLFVILHEHICAINKKEMEELIEFLNSLFNPKEPELSPIPVTNN